MHAHIDHDGPPVEPYPTCDDPDLAYDRMKQDELDNRLTREEIDIAIGCLSTYILHVGRDMRRPGITSEMAMRYREDMRVAGEAMNKLMSGRP